MNVRLHAGLTKEQQQHSQQRRRHEPVESVICFWLAPVRYANNNNNNNDVGLQGQAFFISALVLETLEP